MTLVPPYSTINVKGKIIDLNQPAVMGVINVTPDSFYSGSRTTDKDLIQRCRQMTDDGATILDIGGHSTRPGASAVDEAEELKRVIPAIKQIIQEMPETVISIDTFRAKVAEAAINEGAAIVNDISGGQLDAEMFPTLSHLKVPYILGHMRGNFATMMTETNYENLIANIVDFFSVKIDQLTQLDVKDIIVDPGFGFSKTLDQNYQLLKNLGYFTILGKPLLAGFSRKSMIYKLLEITADEALNGSTILNTIGLMKGASILRVHDVKQAVETVKLYQKVNT